MSNKKHKSRSEFFELFKKYAVQASGVEDFCNRYHSRKAYHDRGKDYMQFDLAGHIKEFKSEGYTMIPQGSTVTGDIVCFYGSNMKKGRQWQE